MTVRDLIDILETYDEDMEVRIGMKQNYGSNFAMRISEVGEYTINTFYGNDHTAVVITEDSQCGVVDYDNDNDDDEDWY